MTGPFRLSKHLLAISGAAIPVVYDTSIGNGVDANGHANLPLRAGASRFFVNSSTGSDTHTSAQAQDATTPVATIAKAMTFCVSGRGDQICVAEGTSYAASLPYCGAMAGFSPLYPFAIQSYNVADPYNEAKHGAAYNGTRPVLNTGATASTTLLQGGGTSPQYLAFRGLDINPGNGNFKITIACNALGANNYMLWENCIRRYTFLGNDQGAATTFPAKHFIQRGCVSYGQWDPSTLVGGLYLEGYSSYTLEDNIDWHCGWSLTAARTDAQAAGGATVFSHPYYTQYFSDGIARRNLTADCSNDGGSYRGGVISYHNLTLNHPTAMLLGGGVNYNVHRPKGVNVLGTQNVAMGTTLVNIAGTAETWGWVTENGKPGSEICYSIIADSGALSGGGYSFMPVAEFPQPTYCDFHHNISKGWASAGHQVESHAGSGANAAYVFDSYEFNQWDDPASGSNVNNASVTYPNAYVRDALYTALGYTGIDAATRYNNFISDLINYPEKKVIRNALTLLFAGYGVPITDTIAPVLSSATATVTGTGTATIGVTTTKGNGIMPWIVTTSSTPPHFQEVWAGENCGLSGFTLAGTVDVTSSGAQTANVTLPTGATYYAYFFHADDFANLSNVAASSSFSL